MYGFAFGDGSPAEDLRTYGARGGSSADALRAYGFFGEGPPGGGDLASSDRVRGIGGGGGASRSRAQKRCIKMSLGRGLFDESKS
mmetsp:Transcript_32311/g.113685  ORF Transcript_32311/g.113685 Transcript_32311/m.113685 type:complete len:85 (-) Transcript_32311:1074-1328(-)